MRFLLIVVLVLMLVPSWTADERLPLYDSVPQVKATRVALDATNAGRTRIGPLTYLGGVHLRSTNWAFGGYSALAVRGDRLLLLSDGGLTLDLTLGRDWHPREVRVGTLPGGPGTGWSKRDRDCESMIVDPATGDLLIGMERFNGVWRYDGALTRTIRSRAPRDMARWPKNGGPEAMARLKDGRYVVFSEDADTPGGGRRSLLFDRDPSIPQARAMPFTFVPPAAYSPTDAATLPDGRLLVLTRALSLSEGFTAKLLLVDPSAATRGAIVRGQDLATFSYPVLHDNFEGVAVSREGDATIVWLLSDDNGPSLFQRTLLLKFRLDLPRTQTPRR